MSSAKLTLSCEPSLVSKAKRLARERRTSVSAMFAQYVKSITEHQNWERELTPRTRQALGLVKKAPNKPYRQLMEEALSEKYGMGR
ncbi:MAG: DUF6364 family protein [Candidatus Sumerlaeota bacterium]|nr:DUF6364 family protein [Candidatus Sumerlaeota bacterium]